MVRSDRRVHAQITRSPPLAPRRWDGGSQLVPRITELLASVGTGQEYWNRTTGIVSGAGVLLRGAVRVTHLNNLLCTIEVPAELVQSHPCVGSAAP